MRIPQEQIDQANQIDLVSFLRSQGEELRQEGRNYRWSRHDSVMITGNKWIQNSTKEGGYPIQFVQKFYNLPFREAVELLTGSGAAPAPMMPTVRRQPKEFCLPDRDPNNNTVINYLTGRGISINVIRYFIDCGDLFQEKSRFPNCVFVGRDPAGTPRYCFKRGTHDYEYQGKIYKYRNETSGSDKRFSFSRPGSNNKLCLFESCIDLLSFMTLFPESGSSHLLSLGGTGTEALTQYLADHHDINCVILCLDADQAGRDAAVRIALTLPPSFKVGCLTPTRYKDWNEALQHFGTVPKLYEYAQRKTI